MKTQCWWKRNERRERVKKGREQRKKSQRPQKGMWQYANDGITLNGTKAWQQRTRRTTYHIEHTHIRDDTIDTAFAGQRQRALVKYFWSPVLSYMFHCHDNPRPCSWWDKMGKHGYGGSQGMKCKTSTQTHKQARSHIRTYTLTHPQTHTHTHTHTHTQRERDQYPEAVKSMAPPGPFTIFPGMIQFARSPFLATYISLQTPSRWRTGKGKVEGNHKHAYITGETLN